MYITPLIAVGIPTWGKVSIKWAQARAHLGFPLGASAVDIYIENEEIANARNAIVKKAIEAKADYVFFLGDDVICPPNTVIQLLSRKVDIVTGIYWTKGYPTRPYIWKGLQRGEYLDWKAGEFFEIDFCGVDCTLIKTDVFKNVEYPWFSRDWLWSDKQDKPTGIETEDFFFYLKAQKSGYKVWADTAIQCLHEDRASGQSFTLTMDMPQASAVSTDEYKGKKIADLGCGTNTPHFDFDCTVVRFDISDKVNPDVKCDLKQIPEPDESYDIVHSRHVLEHFGRHEAGALIHEWTRILKVGGELIINLPNLMYAMRNLIDGKSGLYEWWQLYGAQADCNDFHKNGFIKGTLEKLLKSEPCLGKIKVEEINENLNATAIKVKKQDKFILTDWWNDVHNPKPEIDAKVIQAMIGGTKNE